MYVRLLNQSSMTRIGSWWYVAGTRYSYVRERRLLYLRKGMGRTISRCQFSVLKMKFWPVTQQKQWTSPYHVNPL
jgi:hypothetical protein